MQITVDNHISITYDNNAFNDKTDAGNTDNCNNDDNNALNDHTNNFNYNSDKAYNFQFCWVNVRRKSKITDR